MPLLINIPTFTDERGSLSVIEDIIEFKIRRVYYIYNFTNLERGMHRHKKTIQLAVSINGSCTIYCRNNKDGEITQFVLDSPNQALLLNPEDFHWMSQFSSDCVLLVLASEPYDPKDYILT